MSRLDLARIREVSSVTQRELHTGLQLIIIERAVALSSWCIISINLHTMLVNLCAMFNRPGDRPTNPEVNRQSVSM